MTWIDEELKEIDANQNVFVGERLPALKLETSTITEFEVDFTEPFKEYVRHEGDKVKNIAIIPVKHKGESKILWLNKRNPLYPIIIRQGREGKNTFRVFTTGSGPDTRYVLVKDGL